MPHGWTLEEGATPLGAAAGDARERQRAALVAGYTEDSDGVTSSGLCYYTTLYTYT